MRKEIVVLNKNESMSMTKEKKDQNSENFKEDWKFVSTGTWAMKGDTAFLFVTFEKCEYQKYWVRRSGQWVEDPKPSYETQVTNGSKDKYITYEYLKTYYRK